MGDFLVSPIAPDISGINALRCLVLAPVGIARRLRLVARITPVRSVLAVVILLPLRAPRFPLSGNIAAVAVVIVIPAALLLCAVAIGVGNAIVAALPVSILARDQLILRIEDVSVAVG